MRRLSAYVLAVRTGRELAKDGFSPSRAKCEHCGKRRVVTRGAEYWCWACAWGVLWPETKARYPKFWPVVRATIIQVGTCEQIEDGRWHVYGWVFERCQGIEITADSYAGYRFEDLAAISKEWTTSQVTSSCEGEA